MLPLTRPAPARPSDPRATASRHLPPGQLLAHWLSTAVEDDLQPRLLRLGDGRLVPLPVARWSGPVSAADESMLARATGPVLDVGCGPGRLTAALHRRGVEVLGLELLAEVPVLARAAGAPLQVGDVFAPLPGEWGTVLLADGNVGIGGDAARLLRRVAGLLAAGGRVLCELLPYEDVPGPVRLEGLGMTSSWFGWALPGRRTLPALADSAGLAVREDWECDGRAFAELVRA